MTFDPHAEARRMRWMIGIAGAALADSCVTASIDFLAVPSEPAGMVQTPTPAPVVTAAVPTPLPEVIVPQPAIAPSPALGRDDIKEIQTRLLSFGFDPGPLDGKLGRMTVIAVMNYQQQRGRAQTGQLDRALLDQLRQDLAPKVAASQPQQLRTSHAPPPQQQRRSDGLDFVRDADARLSRWFQSLSH
jgi:peptidoglycan hydrolase-like protein with peptidoglycan-binding domain